MFVSSGASGFSPASIGAVVGIAFWTLIGLGIVWRVVSLIVRHRTAELRSRVVAPLISSAVVQSEILGWKPQAGRDLFPQHSPTVHAPPVEANPRVFRRSRPDWSTTQSPD